MRQALRIRSASAGTFPRWPANETVQAFQFRQEFFCHQRHRPHEHRTFSSRDSAAYPDSLTDPKYRNGAVPTNADAIPVGVYHGERMPQRPPPERVQHYSRRPIYVAATKQHVGKTTTSLALMSGLSKRFDKVGFIKPGMSHY